MLNRKIDTDQKAELPEMDGELVIITEFLYERGQSYATNANAHSDGISKIRLTLYPEHRKAIQDAGYQLSGDVHIPVTMTADRKISAVQMPDGKNWVEVDDTRDNDRQPPVVLPLRQPDEEPDPCAERALNGQASLYAKIAKVMGEVHRVDKTKSVYNSKGETMYLVATGDDLLDMVRPIMARHQLVCIPNMVRIEKEPLANRTGWHNYHGYFVFTVADGETGATIDRLWESEVDDYGDKAINKLSRFATRYFLSNLLQLSTGDADDDPELQASEKPDNRALKQQKQGRAAQGSPSPKSNPVPSGAKPANGGQPKPAAPPVAWQFTDNTVTDLMFETKDWAQSRPERMNTINALRTEGAFEGCANLEAAVGLLKARLEAHHKTDLDALPDEPDGAK